MGLLDGFERLINEHGSSTILRERIALAEDKYALLEKQVSILQAENVSLRQENTALRQENNDLRAQVKALGLDRDELRKELDSLAQRAAHSENPKRYCCDHCGSQGLKRTRSVKDRTFGVLGGKQAVFECLSCGKESFFLETP